MVCSWCAGCLAVVLHCAVYSAPEVRGGLAGGGAGAGAQVGAQVMLLRNLDLTGDARALVNGSRGVVEELMPVKEVPPARTVIASVQAIRAVLQPQAAFPSEKTNREGPLGRSRYRKLSIFGTALWGKAVRHSKLGQAEQLHCPAAGPGEGRDPVYPQPFITYSARCTNSTNTTLCYMLCRRPWSN